MDLRLEQDLHKAYEMMDSKWAIQNEKGDQETRFIYKAQTLEDVIDKATILGVDVNYALHRWYNYQTSIYCEHIFCDYGAVHEKDIYDHDKDIYINNIPFDVKLTVYPSILSFHPFDLNTRTGKDAMIQWFYNSQSKGKRKQTVNRLYVVCDGENPLKMKSDFDKIRPQIKQYMDVYSSAPINTVYIYDNERICTVQSDIILVS